MTDHLRDVDVAARYGEKEFAILLPQADQEQTRHVSERLQNIMCQTTVPEPEGESAGLTASVGGGGFTPCFLAPRNYRQRQDRDIPPGAG